MMDAEEKHFLTTQCCDPMISRIGICSTKKLPFISDLFVSQTRQPTPESFHKVMKKLEASRRWRSGSLPRRSHVFSVDAKPCAPEAGSYKPKYDAVMRNFSCLPRDCLFPGAVCVKGNKTTRHRAIEPEMKSLRLPIIVSAISRNLSQPRAHYTSKYY